MQVIEREARLVDGQRVVYYPGYGWHQHYREAAAAWLRRAGEVRRAHSQFVGFDYKRQTRNYLDMARRYREYAAEYHSLP